MSNRKDQIKEVVPSHNAPVKTFVIEDVSASIFAREISVKGELRTFYSVSFSRSYRDSAGKRKYVKTFNLEDLSKIISLAQQAEQFIRKLLKDEAVA